MPQLDKVTFLSQYFWLLIFFWGFYLFILKAFLPEMSRILKFRKKRFNNESAFSLQEETNKVGSSVSSVVEKLLKNEKNAFKNSQSNNDSWFSELAENVSRKNLKDANAKYVGEIAGKSLSNNLTMLALNPNLSEKMVSNRVSHLILTLNKGSVISSSRGIIQRSLNKNSLSEVSNDGLQSLKRGKSDNLETRSSKLKKDALKKEVLPSFFTSKNQKKEELSDSIKNKDLLSSSILNKKDLALEKSNSKKVSTRHSKSKKDPKSDFPEIEIKDDKKVMKGGEKNDSKSFSTKKTKKK